MANLGNAFITITADNKQALSAIDQTKHGVTGLGNSFRNLAKIVGGIALFEVFRRGVQNVGEFQRQMTDLSFVTTEAKDELKAMEKAILDTALATGQSKEELADAAIAAGRFGVYAKGGKEGLNDFVGTLSRAVVLAPDFASGMGEAGEKLAKLGNVLKVPVERSENLIASLDKTADATAATSGEISEVALRFGALIFTQGKSTKQLEEQATKTIALAAFLKDLGVSTEIAGSSMSKLSLEIVNNKEEFTDFVRRTGGDAEAFSKSVGDDAVKSIEIFIKSLEKLNSEDRAKALQDLSLNNTRMSDALLKAAGSTELLGEKLKIAAEGFEDVEGFRSKFEEAMKTLPQRVAKFQQAIGVLFMKITTNLIPAISDLIDALAQLFTNQDIEGFLTQVVNGFVEIAKVIGSTAVEAVNIFQRAFKGAFDGVSFETVQEGLLSLFKNMKTIVVGLVQAFADIGRAVFEVGKAVAAPIFAAFAYVIKLIADNMSTLIPIIQGLVVAFVSFKVISSIIATFQALQLAMKGFALIGTAEVIPSITTMVAKFVAMGSAGTGLTGVFALMKGAWMAFSTTFLASPIGLAIAGISVGIGFLAAAFFSAQESARKFSEGLVSLDATLQTFNPNVNYLGLSMEQTAIAGNNLVESLQRIRDLEADAYIASMVGDYVEYNRVLEEQNGVIKIAKEELVDMAIAYGENAEEAKKWARELDIASSDAGEKISEHFKGITGSFNDLANLYTNNFKQIVGTQKYSVDNVKDSLRLWEEEMRSTMKANGLTADQIEYRIAAMMESMDREMGRSGDIAERFTYEMAKGMTSSQAIAELRKAGLTVSRESLLKMAAGARQAGNVGQEAALLYAAGVISKKQYSALKGAELTAASIDGMLQTNAKNAGKVARSSGEVVKGAINNMLGIQAKGGEAITDNSGAIGRNFAGNIANGISEKKSLVQNAVQGLLNIFNSVAEDLGLTKIFASFGGGVGSAIDGFVSSIEGSGGAAGQQLELYAELGVAAEDTESKVNGLNDALNGDGSGGGGGGGAKKPEELPAGQYASLMEEINDRLDKATQRTKQSLSLNDENINQFAESGKSIQNELKGISDNLSEFDFTIEEVDLSAFSESAALGFQNLSKEIADNGQEINATAKKYSEFIKETAELNDEMEELDESNITVRNLGDFVTQLAEQVALSARAVGQLENAFQTLYNRARDTIDQLKSKVQELQDTLSTDTDNIDYEIRLLTKQEDIAEAQKRLEEAKADVEQKANLDLLKAQKSLQDGQEKLNELKASGSDASALEVQIQEEVLKNLQKELSTAQEIAANVESDESVQRAKERLDLLNQEKTQLELIRKIQSQEGVVSGGQLVSQEDIAALNTLDEIQKKQVEKAIIQREAQDKIAKAQEKAAAFEQVVNALKAGSVALEGDRIQRTKEGGDVTDSQIEKLQKQFDVFSQSTDEQDVQYANQLRQLAATKMAFETEKAQLAELKLLQEQAQETFRLYSDEERRIKQEQYDSDVRDIENLVQQHKNMSEEQKSNINSVKEANKLAIQEVITELNRQKVAADAATRAWLAAAAAKAAASGGGFYQGGYTGSGALNEVAGVVHRGEYVIPNKVLRKLQPTGVMSMLEKMRHGFRGGGYTSGGSGGILPVIAGVGGAGNSTTNNFNLDIQQQIQDRADLSGAFDELTWKLRQKLAT